MRFSIQFPTIAAMLVLRLSAAAEITTGEVSSSLPVLKEGSVFDARDTLDCGAESSADAADCLAGLRWKPAPFTVRCEPAENGQGDWLMRFPSPLPSGDATNDLCAMEWYVARDKDGQPMRAPAVVIVHESGRGMVAGRIFATGLKAQGLHTFLVQLPGYGARTSAFTADIQRMLPGLQQAVADVRRARDAVAALPFIDTSLIALQGTSLGGFVTATVAGLDHGYNRIFILLAGGNLADMVLTGERDAAKFREALTAAGVTEEQIRQFVKVVEPMRLAHRVDAARTWLFSGTEDEVVPPRCSLAFAKAAGLIDGHHVEMPVGHYTAAIMLPTILQQIGALIRGPAQP
ncbi:MAG TPA: prolyl oligopeptidase family serine peptidase [Chthoniobacteraceae bacterium]|nr:prolyl oligopeptidase family serine peptidase [Chthoniobacteraceae bacterium]